MPILGSTELVVDAEWRVRLPTACRAAFGRAVRMTPGDAGCWRIDPLGDTPPGTVADPSSAVDHSGTLTIPVALRDGVPVTAPFPAVFLGMGDHAELWSADALRAIRSTGAHHG